MYILSYRNIYVHRYFKDTVRKHCKLCMYCIVLYCNALHCITLHWCMSVCMYKCMCIYYCAYEQITNRPIRIMYANLNVHASLYTWQTWIELWIRNKLSAVLTNYIILVKKTGQKSTGMDKQLDHVPVGPCRKNIGILNIHNYIYYTLLRSYIYIYSWEIIYT